MTSPDSLSKRYCHARSTVAFRRLRRRLLLAAAATSGCSHSPQWRRTPLKLGLVAAMSGQSAKSGEAIVRGLSIAIDEINAKGGVLGKKVELVVRDDESNPAKGAVAARELVQREKVAALFGGLDTPVSMAIVPFANQSKVPFMGVWAAGTPITRNGAAENYVFRVSAVDVLVDKALVDYAIKKYSAKKPGMILINNPWGESNEKGLKARSKRRTCPMPAIEKFQDADVDVVPQLTRLKEAGADVLVHGRQRRAVVAGGEVARPHGLERSDRLALGTGRRPFQRTRRTRAAPRCTSSRPSASPASCRRKPKRFWRR